MTALLQASSRPIQQLPAETACPLCSEWHHELLSTARRNNVPGEHTLMVTSSDLERHLSTHHEQLALFAVAPEFEKMDELSGEGLQSERQRTKEVEEVSFICDSSVTILS
jgi:hypothetical protein